jgi:hypothetical protein
MDVVLVARVEQILERELLVAVGLIAFVVPSHGVPPPERRTRRDTIIVPASAPDNL